MSDTFTLEANAQYLRQASPQLLGVNRRNQDLIDHGRYYTGDMPDLGYSEAGAIAGTIPGDRWVDLPRDATLLSPGDYSNAEVYRGQLIATAKAALGDLDRVERVVKVLGMVNATPDFGQHPQVINGCSDLLVEVFGGLARGFGAGGRVVACATNSAAPRIAAVPTPASSLSKGNSGVIGRPR